MQITYVTFFFIITYVCGACTPAVKEKDNSDLPKTSFTIYSKTIKDSFEISVHLPERYNKDSSFAYPVAYMLDANFHFPMLAATLAQYEKAGILPPIVLVGIGYKSFDLMDSLRNRDYLYPAALPSDELQNSGGGNDFYDFIITQLVPYIDTHYHIDTASRSLLGHSFGGYFSLFALLKQTENHRHTFKHFGAASPSLWYHNFYLNQLPNKLKSLPLKDSLSLFVTAGGSEDSTWNIAPLQKLATAIRTAQLPSFHLEVNIYSGLAHMDVATITFAKALEAFYIANK